MQPHMSVRMRMRKELGGGGGGAHEVGAHDRAVTGAQLTASRVARVTPEASRMATFPSDCPSASVCPSLDHARHSTGTSSCTT